jgi:hypothetical protein
MATVNLGRVKPIFRGPYSAGTAYTPLDFVTYNGLTYFCILASTGNAPTNTTYWQMVVDGAAASAISYDHGVSGLAASNVQTAIDEVVVRQRLPSSYFFRTTSMTGGNAVSTGKYVGSSSATERRTLNIPSMQAEIGGISLTLTTGTTKDLNTAGSWDSSTYATAANRAGKDFYVYACIPSTGTTPDFILSANGTTPSSMPSGATPTASNTRKVGGFHALCVAVGTISGHDLTGYLVGDILPRSVWDLEHRPISAPEGMVYGKHGQWVDIYLPSVSGGELVSVNGGTIADGVSATAFHAYKFDQWYGRIGKKSIASLEFVAASIGANQGTNITGSGDPGTTGGHTDTAGRRMISNIGCEDMCGVLWQWGREQGGANSGTSWVTAYDGNDSGVAGQHYMAPTRPLFGGSWDSGALCGSRGSSWANSPLNLSSSYSSRGVAEPAAVRQ